MLTFLGLKPRQEGGHRAGQIARVGADEVSGRGCITVHDCLTAAGGDPHEHIQLTCLPQAAGVMRSELGFAYAAEPCHHTHDRGRVHIRKPAAGQSGRCPSGFGTSLKARRLRGYCSDLAGPRGR